MDNDNLIIFNSEKFGKIRCVKINSKLYIVGNDIAKALGYSNTRDPIGKYCRNILSKNILTSGGRQKMNIISTHDVITLIQKSKTKSENYKEKFINWLTEKELIKNKIFLESRKEIEFLDMLEKVLKPFDYFCIRQHHVCNNKYRIDLYIKDLNIAIEYDERNHTGYKNDEYRQKEIEKELGCRFIRINDNKDDYYNVGLIMKQLIA